MARSNGGRNRNRANGEGWINKRADGRGYDVGLHIEHPDGTVERRSTTKKRRSDAQSWLTEQMSQRSQGLIVSNENPRLSVYLRAWLKETVEGTVAPVTYKHYGRMVENHIIPVLGGVKIKELTPRHVQHLHSVKYKESLALGTRRHIHVALKKALSQAHAWNDIPTNPAAYVKPPRGRANGSKEREEDIQPFSEEELREIRAASKNDRLHALYVFAPACGLREQELCALKWRDLDLPEDGSPGVVRVRNAVVETEDGFEIQKVKTKKSRRSVEFPAKVVPVLLRHRELQQQMSRASSWEDPELVFPTARGTLMNRYRLGHNFRKLRASAGIDPRHQFRDFRHTFATLMFARGWHPKKVQEMMGHKSIKITLDTYSHYIPGIHGGAGDALGDLF